MKRNSAGTYFKTIFSTFPAPCTSNPFDRDTHVSSPLDSGFFEVPSPCIFTQYVEDISLFTLDLKTYSSRISRVLNQCISKLKTQLDVS